jgi:phage shock protein A
MGLIDRMNTVVKAKINKILNKFEDPRETLAERQARCS